MIVHRQCSECGADFAQEQGWSRGRPRKVCSDECAKRRMSRLKRERYYAARSVGNCVVCLEPARPGMTTCRSCAMGASARRAEECA